MACRYLTLLISCCCGGVFFLCRVQLSECRVSLLTRNVTDSFRVGEEGCKGDQSICTSVQASCQENGLCLCKEEYPHFRNPTIIKSAKGNNYPFGYGDTYGCVGKELIKSYLGVGE